MVVLFVAVRTARSNGSDVESLLTAAIRALNDTWPV